ncbi:MAG TPA: ATP-binding protein [Candidatus Omnitrophota bacterium]|nr:ATP-binding protein [Candidatus Omnitrophota bacterium]
MFRSVRVTLTLWYVGILTAILCILGSVFYSQVYFHLYQNVDQRLLTQADGIADTISAFWQAEWQIRHKSMLFSEEERSALPKAMGREVMKGRFEPLIYRWATETKILETTSRPFRLILASGKIVVSHSLFNKILSALPVDALPNPQNATDTVYRSFRLPSQHVRTISRPVMEDNNLLYTVQTFVDLTQEDQALGDLRQWLLILIPAVVLVTSIVGWFLATLALRPVGNMTEKALKIGANRLNERVIVPKTGDELEHLAETFNGMLSRLERAFKRLRQFSAAASHELRTPLTIMKGELEVALRKPREADEYRRVLQTQLQAINEITSIVEQLLMLAHSEEGEEGVEWRRVDVGDLAREACQTWEKIAQNKNIRVHFTEKKPTSVRGERRLLSRIVSNLLDNAIRHTPQGGEVFCEVREEDAQAVLSVQDTGPGIPPDVLPGLFDRFFIRGSAAAQISSSGGGVGLGLGLCRWIAEAHQGRIEGQSKPGRGALFIVRIPVYAESKT